MRTICSKHYENEEQKVFNTFKKVNVKYNIVNVAVLFFQLRMPFLVVNVHNNNIQVKL